MRLHDYIKLWPRVNDGLSSLIDCTDEGEEPNDVYISKLALGLGRSTYFRLFVLSYMLILDVIDSHLEAKGRDKVFYSGPPCHM